MDEDEAELARMGGHAALCIVLKSIWLDVIQDIGKN